MHARELAELAAQLATQGGATLRSAGNFDQKGIEQYWVASRCRLDRWAKAIGRYTKSAPDAETAERAKLWSAVRPTLQEILVSEVLTRIWTVVVIGHDKLSGASELAPVARSILVGHLEARHRTLQLILNEPGCTVEEAVALNRLRRRCERWNDIVLSALHDQIEVAEFAFDMTRVRDVAGGLPANPDQRISQPAWQILLASLRVSFPGQVEGVAANPDLNERIASGVMLCFPATTFDSLRVLRPSWLVRMDSITSETQGMIREVLSDEDAFSGSHAAVQLLEEALRHC